MDILIVGAACAWVGERKVRVMLSGLVRGVGGEGWLHCSVTFPSEE